MCGAKKRNGEPCPTPPMPNGRCRMHGGATPRGAASPHFKHGRYSKAFPHGLAERIETARADLERLSLRDEIALIDARNMDLMGEDMTDADWRTIERNIDRRCRLVISETRWLVRSRQMLSAAEAMALVAGLADVVKRHVLDPATVAAIGREFEALLTQPNARTCSPRE